VRLSPRRIYGRRDTRPHTHTHTHTHTRSRCGGRHSCFILSRPPKRPADRENFFVSLRSFVLVLLVITYYTHNTYTGMILLFIFAPVFITSIIERRRMANGLHYCVCRYYILLLLLCIYYTPYYNNMYNDNVILLIIMLIVILRNPIQ